MNISKESDLTISPVGHSALQSCVVVRRRRRKTFSRIFKFLEKFSDPISENGFSKQL